jgi:hypothetical protein
MARSSRGTPPVTNQHKTSPRDPSSRLSEEQKNAIPLLLQGMTDHAVAAQVGCARETVSRWRLNPFFVATLNQERKDLWEAAHQRLRGLVHKSIDILEKALTAGDAKAAMELLRIIGIAGNVPAPSGETNPEAIVYQEADAWTKGRHVREGPTVDFVQTLLHEGADKDAAMLRERLGTLREAWGMDEGSEP